MSTFRLDRTEVNSLDVFVSVEAVEVGDLIYWKNIDRNPELVVTRLEPKEASVRMECPYIRTISQDSSGVLVSVYAQIIEDPFQYVEILSRISHDLEEQDEYSAKLMEALK